MRALFLLGLGMFAMALATTRPANAAENSGAVYAVTYFEAAAPDVAKVATLTRQFGEASRKDAGQCRVRHFSGNRPPEPLCDFRGMA